MLLEANHLSKTLGASILFHDVSFSIMPGEKIALIGRNGYGKSTLLKMLGQEDLDFEGHLSYRKGIQITLTKQEHIDNNQQSPFEYILHNIPQFFSYKKIMDDYEQGRNHNLEQYLDVLERFNECHFSNLEDAILNTLSDFGIPLEAALQPLVHLSGGQKRYMEMTRMMFSQADLLLIDEPTNHLDYLGKARFISWLQSLKKAVVVVTHDRDVLKQVQKIMELKDKKIEIFKGNYDHYITHNTNQTLNSVKDYTDQLNRLQEAKKRMEWGLQMRAKSKQWKIRYDHWLREYEKVKAETIKPAFWIDQESVENLDKKVSDSYQKFKEKNIRINITSQREHGVQHLLVRDLALGYDKIIFQNLNFSLRDNQRLFIKGKNGAGKSSFVKTLVAMAENKKPATTTFAGEIILGPALRIGEYQQEIDQSFLPFTLEQAIRQSYAEQHIDISDQNIKSLLAQYLFNPVTDAQQKIMNLSGGQKARFQLIKMLINEPNLLVLDEPTNHLDLPSIEELENALQKFQGAILYISHDSYFIQKMGGEKVEL